MGANVMEKLYYTLGGIILCLVAIVSWMFLINKSGKKRRSNDNEDEDKSCRFYINVFVLNKREVIKEKVKSKFGSFKYLGNAVAMVAGKLVTDEKFSKILYEKMSVIIPEKLREELGVDSSVELEYSNKSYFVVSVDIKAADARFLVKMKGGEQHLKVYDNLVTHLFGNMVHQRLSDQLVGIIGEKLIEKIPERVIERMKDGGGVDVEAVAKSESEQARYFFTAMKLISKSNTSSPEIVGEVSTSVSSVVENKGDTNVTYNDNESDGVYVTSKDGLPDNTHNEETAAAQEKKSGWYPGKYMRKFTTKTK